jgi:hypothetical protein
VRLRRQTFVPIVMVTSNARRPVALTVAGLEFDCTRDDAQHLAAALIQALEEIGELS